MEISVEPGDITRVHADAIVNAANSTLLGGGGVDGAIHRVGGPEILAATKEIRRTRLPDGLPVGAAVSTEAGRLPARWVIHTVGPVYAKDTDRTHLLRNAYVNSIREAERLGARSIAFPTISAGVYGWPHADAVRVAVDAVRSTATSLRVIFVPFSEELTDLFQQALAAAQ